jgi:hypothetical protein
VSSTVTIESELVAAPPLTLVNEVVSVEGLMVNVPGRTDAETACSVASAAVPLAEFTDTPTAPSPLEVMWTSSPVVVAGEVSAPKPLGEDSASRAGAPHSNKTVAPIAIDMATAEARARRNLFPVSPTSFPRQREEWT